MQIFEKSAGYSRNGLKTEGLKKNLLKEKGGRWRKGASYFAYTYFPNSPISPFLLKGLRL